jgi:hypothetical protein
LISNFQQIKNKYHNMTEPRNAAVISCEILSLIPETEKNFRSDVCKLLLDYAYVSPEMLRETTSWCKLDAIMRKYIPTINEINTEWKRDAIEKYTNVKYDIVSQTM